VEISRASCQISIIVEGRTASCYQDGHHEAIHGNDCSLVPDTPDIEPSCCSAERTTRHLYVSMPP
jgi:hypothetical protein